MDTLPTHGRIQCTRCFPNKSIDFDVSEVTQGDWRIRANPLAWGSVRPRVVVLGFSKGPTQAGALATAPHEDIAYKGSRANVGRILSHIGVLDMSPDSDFAQQTSAAIADPDGAFHFGSLIRCTVQRFDHKSQKWEGSGGGMLDQFVATEFGHQVASNCVRQHLSQLPTETRLVVMFGMGQKLGYVKSAFELFKSARGGDWQWLNEVAYTDGLITVVHVEHFASQGRLLPEWLNPNTTRGRLGTLSRVAVTHALSGMAPMASSTQRPNTDRPLPAADSIENGSRNRFRLPKSKFSADEDHPFSTQLSFVLKNGTEIYPVRMKNRTDGRLAFRVSKGGTEGNLKENTVEIEDENEMVRHVTELGYAVRAASLDRQTKGLYKIEGRSVARVNQTSSLLLSARQD